MTALPPKHCLYDKCGKEITKNQHCAETPDQFAERYNSGYCRAKCKRQHTPSKSERGKQTLELISHNVGRVETVAQEKDLPERDEKYLAWIRTLPCLVPGCNVEAQAHHQNKRKHGGKGTTASDYRAAPLCIFHHRLGGYSGKMGSYHGEGKISGWGFWKYYAVDVEATIHNLNRMWLESGHKFKEW